MEICIKRIYDPAEPSDGVRVLVDRLWPRGVSKARAAVDVWAKDLAPSTKLRTWFAHQPARFDEFARRYCDELSSVEHQLADLYPLLMGQPKLTLLYAARNRRVNHAVVLEMWLQQYLEKEDEPCRP